jgi:hypothetical protein
MNEIITLRLLSEAFGTIQKVMVPEDAWLLSACPTPAHGDVNLHFVTDVPHDPKELKERRFLVVHSDLDGFEADLSELIYVDTIVYHTHTLYVFEIDEETGSWLE